MTNNPNTLAAHRATMDAIDSRYYNRETSQGAKKTYDARHLEVRRAIEAVEPALGTDADVHKAGREQKKTV